MTPKDILGMILTVFFGLLAVIAFAILILGWAVIGWLLK